MGKKCRKHLYFISEDSASAALRHTLEKHEDIICDGVDVRILSAEIGLADEMIGIGDEKTKYIFVKLVVQRIDASPKQKKHEVYITAEHFDYEFELADESNDADAIQDSHRMRLNIAEAIEKGATMGGWLNASWGIKYNFYGNERDINKEYLAKMVAHNKFKSAEELHIKDADLGLSGLIFNDNLVIIGDFTIKVKYN